MRDRQGSLIELLGPGFDGAPMILGGAWPDQLRPPAPSGALSSVLVLAPTDAEWADRRRRRHMLDYANRLPPSGIVYALAGLGTRTSVTGELRQLGLRVRAAYLHLPNRRTGRLLVGLAEPAARYALTTFVPARAMRRRALLAALALPGGATALRHVLPDVGLVASRDRDFEPSWLSALSPSGSVTSAIFAGRGAPGAPSTALVQGFASRSELPVVTARVALTGEGEARVARRMAAITELRTDAERAGVVVPQVLNVTQLRGRAVVVESTLRGRIAAVVLHDTPGALAPLIASVATWLERWHHLTVVSTVQHGRMESVRAAAARVRGALPLASPYIERFLLSWERDAPRVPWVAVHGDLTMWNVLLDSDGTLGIVDWEGGHRHGVPLADLVYAIVDASAAADSYDDRPSAFDAAFVNRSPMSATFRDLIGRVGGAAGLTPALANLCFHACWLQHAADDVAKGGTRGRSSFLAIIERLAARQPANELSSIW